MPTAAKAAASKSLNMLKLDIGSTVDGVTVGEKGSVRKRCFGGGGFYTYLEAERRAAKEGERDDRPTHELLGTWGYAQALVWGRRCNCYRTLDFARSSPISPG